VTVKLTFEDAVIEVFSKLKSSDFKVNQNIHRLFLCGGDVNVKAETPPSFRDRFITHFSINSPELGKGIVLAEKFKDYFKDSAYPDLLVFEDEIANLASLVIIFLESPGSLVELGMFCTKPNFYEKLIIVAPSEETKEQDSFIYLGPLENIRRKEPSSIALYPWPKPTIKDYDQDHLIDLLESVESKISKIHAKVQFNNGNSGHMAMLVAEIIRLTYPILITEIEYALAALELDVTLNQVKRHIYLLTRLEFIAFHEYGGGYTYYYPIQTDISLIRFGENRNGRKFDEGQFKMAVKQSYVLNKDSQSRKRLSAGRGITKILKGDVE
jgi:hypothetical protein